MRVGKRIRAFTKVWEAVQSSKAKLNEKVKSFKNL